MSSAIDFAVRTSAGGTTYGTVAGGGSNFIQTGLGDSVSLNLAPGSVLSYTRQGSDLVIELADGQTITLADWFDTAPGVQNHLYLSSDGMITEVFLTDLGDGVLGADLSFVAGGEKWSPLDSLRFGDSDPVIASVGTGQDEPAGMGIFAPALLGIGGAGLGTAALVGGGLIIGGGGGGGGGGGPVYTRTIDGSGTSTTITTNTAQPGIDVGGTGIPGDTVAVTIGNQTQTVTVANDGTWTTSFSGNLLPADGTHTATATFTGSGTTTTLTGGGFIIDMTPPPVAATEGFQSNGAVENLAEYADGVTLRGTTEPGATVSVTLGVPGQQGALTRAAAVNPDGTWSITFTPQEIAGGERSQTVTVTATDTLGNVRTLTETVVLDTIAPPLSVSAVSGDGWVNRIESQSQTILGGTAAANATVSLQIDGLAGRVTVTADGNGVWSHALAANSLTDGTYTFTATTTDVAGNPTEQRGSFRVDTQMSVGIDAGFAGNDVVSLSESQGALTLRGTVPMDATRVEVTWLGQPVPATLHGDGTWSVTFAAGTATRTQDSTVTVSAWDAAGNRADSTPRPVRIDLETAMTLPEPAGADRILSGTEQRSGVTLTGDGEAGARIFLNLNGTNYGPVAVGADGKWTHAFTAADLSGFSHGQQVTLTAYAIDAAGNRSTPDLTRTFTVDTQVGDFSFAAPDLQLGPTADSVRDATVLNATERNAGLPIQGTVEPGATVTIRIAETGWTTTIPASQTQNGIWRFTLPPESLPQGAATSATISATATDAQGNISAQSIDRTVAIDTVVANFNAADVRLGTGNDGTLNAREHALGLPVSGQAEPGSTVNVTLNGHTRTAVAGVDGLWSVAFTPDQISAGERSGIPVSVTATDTAGNTSGPHIVSFDVDTIAPSTPNVVETQDVAGAMRGLTTTATSDAYTFHRVDATGAPVRLTATETHDSFFNEDLFRFQNGQTVPDGSYLVINTRDAAGNEANTLFIKNTATGVSVDLNREGLAAFDLSTIDLTRAPDARLTVNDRQLESLTGPDERLFVRGEASDQVTLQNVTGVRENVVVNGQIYDIYTLGNNGAQVLLEDDVTRTVI